MGAVAVEPVALAEPEPTPLPVWSEPDAPETVESAPQIDISGDHPILTSPSNGLNGMILRTLGLNAMELETGPLTFLISHGIPVAYRDRRPEAMSPGVYRTNQRFNKAVTRHVNTWLAHRAYSTIPHDLVVSTFQGISRYTEQEATV